MQVKAARARSWRHDGAKRLGKLGASDACTRQLSSTRLSRRPPRTDTGSPSTTRRSRRPRELAKRPTPSDLQLARRRSLVQYLTVSMAPNRTTSRTIFGQADALSVARRAGAAAVPLARRLRDFAAQGCHPSALPSILPRAAGRKRGCAPLACGTRGRHHGRNRPSAPSRSARAPANNPGSPAGQVGVGPDAGYGHDENILPAHGKASQRVAAAVVSCRMVRRAGLAV